MLYDRSRQKNSRIAKRGGLRYGTRTYANPFFGERTERRVRMPSASTRTKIIIAAVVLVLFMAGGAILYSPYFRVKAVSVSGGTRVPPSAVEQAAWDYFHRQTLPLIPSDNLVLANLNVIRRQLESTYAFTELSLGKKFPATVSIRYVEKDYAYLWQERGTYQYIDEHGFVIETVSPEAVAGMQYLRFDNDTGRTIENRRVPLADTVLPAAAFIRSRFTALGESYRIDHMSIPSEFDQLIVYLVDGPRLHFSTKEDLTKQIDKLTILKDEKLKEAFTDKEYIDLQYGDTIYYK